MQVGEFVSRAVDAADAPLAPFSFDPATTVVFKIVSNAMDNRKHIKVYHPDSANDKISVAVCKAVANDPLVPQLIVWVGEAPPVLLSMSRLAEESSLQQLPNILRWQVSIAHARPAMKPLALRQLGILQDD